MSGNQFGYVFESLAVASRRGLTVSVTLGTLDEIKGVTIAIETSVELIPLLVCAP